MIVQEVQDYLRVIQTISMYRADSDDVSTPYAFNMQRMDAHERMFSWLQTHLNLAPGFTIDDSYERSKDIFYHLDRVFRLFNDFDLDLCKTEHIIILAEDLSRYLLSTEVLNFLGGRANKLSGVIED